MLIFIAQSPIPKLTFMSIENFSTQTKFSASQVNVVYD